MLLYFHVGAGFPNIRLRSCTCPTPLCACSTGHTWHNTQGSGAAAFLAEGAFAGAVADARATRASEAAGVHFELRWGPKSKTSGEEVLGLVEGVFWGLSVTLITGWSGWAFSLGNPDSLSLDHLFSQPKEGSTLLLDIEDLAASVLEAE